MHTSSFQEQFEEERKDAKRQKHIILQQVRDGIPGQTIENIRQVNKNPIFTETELIDYLHYLSEIRRISVELYSALLESLTLSDDSDERIRAAMEIWKTYTWKPVSVTVVADWLDIVLMGHGAYFDEKGYVSMSNKKYDRMLVNMQQRKELN